MASAADDPRHPDDAPTAAGPAGPTELARWIQPGPLRRPVVSLSTAALVLLGAQVASLLWAGVVLSLRYRTTEMPSPLPMPTQLLATLGLWIGYGVGPLLALRAGAAPDEHPASLRAWFGPLRAMDLLVGGVVGVGAQLVVIPLVYWPLVRLFDLDPGESARRMADSADGVVPIILFALAVVVVAPVVEELAFRWTLTRALSASWGPVVASLGSAAVFALVHRDPTVMPGLFVFAAALAVLTLRTDRLAPAVIAHAAFNATTVVLVTLAR
ncbi:MAG: lysostaphin resistance A-like protein [Acidimicrobiales bacterium]